jgi:hypothetical protein
MNFFKAFRIMGVLTTWLEKALVDGVIDAQEISELLVTLLGILGVEAKIKIDMDD